MSRGDFKRGPFLFESDTDEDGQYPVFDPFSIEPAQMAAPDEDLNRPNLKIEKLARETKPGHIFRFLDYLYSKGPESQDSAESPASDEQNSDVRRRGKLNWHY